MIVEYNLAPSDYVAFSLYHNAHTPAAQKSIRWMRFGIAAMWLAFALFPLALGEPLDGGEAVYVGMAVLWVLLVPAFVRWSVRRTAARYYERGLVNGQIGVHRVELTDTGFRDSTPVTDWHVTWPAVERVAEGAEHLFVYVGPHAAHIIPKSALGDRLDSFRQVIEQRAARHRQT
jgi:cobalamin biosynthesis protein CobD/CbiB